MYNLIEYSGNSSKTSGSLWQYCKYVPALNDNGIIADFGEGNLTDSFDFKAKITGQTGDNERKEVEINGPIKIFKQFLNNSWNGFN